MHRYINRGIVIEFLYLGAKIDKSTDKEMVLRTGLIKGRAITAMWNRKITIKNDKYITHQRKVSLLSHMELKHQNLTKCRIKVYVDEN